MKITQKLNLFLAATCLLVCLVSCSSGATVDYEWTTDNDLPYMCQNQGVTVTSGDGTNSHIICAQADYPINASSNASNVLTCPQGTIKCLIYATYGKAGGACSGDPFQDDPSGEWVYVPEDLADLVIGESTFTLLPGDDEINDVPAVIVDGPQERKLKVLAYCDADVWTSSNFLSTKLSLMIIAVLALFY